MVEIAHQVFARHFHVVEKQFVELDRAGDVAQRPHLHAGGLHIHQQDAQAAMLGRAGIGARQQQAPVGQVCERSPDLLAVEDEAISKHLRPGSQRGQVGAGARF